MMVRNRREKEEIKYVFNFILFFQSYQQDWIQKYIFDYCCTHLNIIFLAVFSFHHCQSHINCNVSGIKQS